MLTTTNVIVQIDALETILQSVLEAKPDPESAEEAKKLEQNSQHAESEETEQSNVPEYYRKFKVKQFNFSKYSKLWCISVIHAQKYRY